MVIRCRLYVSVIRLCLVLARPEPLRLLILLFAVLMLTILIRLPMRISLLSIRFIRIVAAVLFVLVLKAR